MFNISQKWIGINHDLALQILLIELGQCQDNHFRKEWGRGEGVLTAVTPHWSGTDIVGQYGRPEAGLHCSQYSLRALWSIMKQLSQLDLPSNSQITTVLNNILMSTMRSHDKEKAT